MFFKSYGTLGSRKIALTAHRDPQGKPPSWEGRVVQKALEFQQQQKEDNFRSKCNSVLVSSAVAIIKPLRTKAVWRGKGSFYLTDSTSHQERKQRKRVRARAWTDWRRAAQGLARSLSRLSFFRGPRAHDQEWHHLSDKHKLTKRERFADCLMKKSRTK